MACLYVSAPCLMHSYVLVRRHVQDKPIFLCTSSDQQTTLRDERTISVGILPRHQQKSSIIYCFWHAGARERVRRRGRSSCHRQPLITDWGMYVYKWLGLGIYRTKPQKLMSIRKVGEVARQICSRLSNFDNIDAFLRLTRCRSLCKMKFLGKFSFPLSRIKEVFVTTDVVHVEKRGR